VKTGGDKLRTSALTGIKQDLTAVNKIQPNPQLIRMYRSKVSIGAQPRTWAQDFNVTASLPTYNFCVKEHGWKIETGAPIIRM
jgi:hypothetical protein